ncbi:MAG: DUF5696 domain-containing protein [Kiritimatiellaeota bacterium]|nr:DUF5696 domain-containing protein [Kiritimatiellota bacterium]
MKLKIIKTPKMTRIEIIDGGRTWGPVSLAEFDVYDKPLKRVERVTELAVEKYRKVAGGCDVTLVDAPHKMSVVLRVRKVGGELSVEMPMESVVEADTEMYRLFAVNVLPGLLTLNGMPPAATSRHRSEDLCHPTLLLPINTGLLCPLKGKPAVRDRFLVYGEQERWELTPTLPFCAGWDKDGGLMALARQGACDAECRVATDGKGGGETGFAFSLRRTWVDPVDTSTREVRWMPIKGDNPVMFCATRLRTHIMKDLGKKTLRERAAESPEVAYLAQAYIMKQLFGIRNVGYYADSLKQHKPGDFVLHITFDETAECFRKLKAAGIDKILTQCTGWNIDGHDGLYPTRFPVDERLGGEKAFRRMIQEGNALGFNIQVHDNFIMQAKRSPEFKKDWCTTDIHGEPLIHGRWAGGVECSGWPLMYPQSYFRDHLKRMKGLGIKGMYYVDYMEQPLEVNYHPVHKGPRSDCAKGQVRIIEECRKAFGACGTEFGFLPCAVAADHISTCGDAHHLMWCKPEWPIMALVDKDNVVPVWQIAMSGLTVLEARSGVAWWNVMTCLLYGCAPRDEWAKRPGIMPILDDTRIAALKAVYDLCVVKFGHLKFHGIVDYKRHAKDIHETRFADGTRVRADFKKMRLFVNGKPIPRNPAFT